MNPGVVGGDAHVSSRLLVNYYIDELSGVNIN